jgi:hypothetical protein
MEQTIYKGFVIHCDKTSCIVLSEKNHATFNVPLINGVPPAGNTPMPDGHICNIFEKPIVSGRLWSACNCYTYDLRRKRERYQKQKQKASSSASE